MTFDREEFDAEMARLKEMFKDCVLENEEMWASRVIDEEQKKVSQLEIKLKDIATKREIRRTYKSITILFESKIFHGDTEGFNA